MGYRVCTQLVIIRSINNKYEVIQIENKQQTLKEYLKSIKPDSNIKVLIYENGFFSYRLGIDLADMTVIMIKNHFSAYLDWIVTFAQESSFGATVSIKQGGLDDK